MSTLRLYVDAVNTVTSPGVPTDATGSQHRADARRRHSLEPLHSVPGAPVVTLDALLAIAHHLAVFSLVSLLVVELVLVRAPMTAGEVARFVRIDGLYGLSAIAVLVAGVARVAWGRSQRTATWGTSSSG